MEWKTNGVTELRHCSSCDEETEHAIEIVDDVEIAICSECDNEEMIGPVDVED